MEKQEEEEKEEEKKREREAVGYRAMRRHGVTINLFREGGRV